MPDYIRIQPSRSVWYQESAIHKDQLAVQVKANNSYIPEKVEGQKRFHETLIKHIDSFNEKHCRSVDAPLNQPSLSVRDNPEPSGDSHEKVRFVTVMTNFINSFTSGVQNFLESLVNFRQSKNDSLLEKRIDAFLKNENYLKTKGIFREDTSAPGLREAHAIKKEFRVRMEKCPEYVKEYNQLREQIGGGPLNLTGMPKDIMKMIELFHEVAKHESSNRMTANSLARMIAPALMTSEDSVQNQNMTETEIRIQKTKDKLEEHIGFIERAINGYRNEDTSS